MPNVLIQRPPIKSLELDSRSEGGSLHQDVRSASEIDNCEYIEVTKEDVENDSWLGYEDGYVDET